MKQKAFNMLMLLAVCGLGMLHYLDHTPNKDEPKKVSDIKVVEVKPSFFTKSPEDGLKEALEYYEIKHPHIVYAQAVLETGNFTSNLCLKNNNLFGLYDSKNKKYYSYKHWWESAEAYKKLIQRKYDNSKYYYMFLEDIKYAKDKDYINKLKKIAEELE